MNEGTSTAAGVAVAATLIEFDAPVRRVLVLEDRAQVTRGGRIALPAGASTLRIGGVAPVASDRSLTVRAGSLRVDRAHIRRSRRIGRSETPAELAAVQEQMEQLVRESNARRAVHDNELQRRDALDQAADLLIAGIDRQLPQAAAWEAHWEAELATLSDAIRPIEQELQARRCEVRDLGLRHAALKLRADALARPDQVVVADIEIAVTADAAGEYEIAVDYFVPCALWRPVYRAQLAPPQVRIECEAAIWQRTGEDWVDVELAVSTARPTQEAEPAVLHDDEIRIQPRSERGVQVAVREEQIATTGEGAAAGPGRSEPPGVDDGGETRRMTAAAAATIRSTGRLHRVSLHAFAADAQIDRVARPERSPLVHLRSRQVNAGPQPLLAGPVELLRDGGYAGLTEVGFVAQGERFALSWGGDPALRVERRQGEERETAKLTGRQTLTRTVELFLSNLDPKPATFRVEERVPVSEIEKVTVTVDERATEPPATADAQGIVGWEVALAPKSTKQLRLVYRLSAASEVKGL